MSERAVEQATRPCDSDGELACRIAGGDVDAWNTFFDRYSKWAFRFCYNHLDRNHSNAEDLCSDILMTAAKSMGKYDSSRGTLDMWMHGLAKNRLARFCRGRRIELPLMPETDHPSSNNNHTIDALLEETLTRDVVNRTLASLPERQTSVLIGKYVEGFSTDELARISRTTPKAIESLLVRARAAFRSAYNGLLNGQGGAKDER